MPYFGTCAWRAYGLHENEIYSTRLHVLMWYVKEHWRLCSLMPCLHDVPEELRQEALHLSSWPNDKTMDKNRHRYYWTKFWLGWICTFHHDCYYSRYPFAFKIRQANSDHIVSCLRWLFSTLGLPEEIFSDNGTIFCSQDFEVFLKSNGIRHIRSSVYYPQSNGLIERFHSTLKSRIRRIRYDKNWPLDIYIDKVLYDIRSTLNETTGETPFSRPFGRRITTKLDLFIKNANYSPKLPARPSMEVYQKRSTNRRSTRSYVIGDNVIMRWGTSQPFIYRGKVKKILSDRTYIIETNGRSTQCNSTNLKPTPNRDEDYEDALDAFRHSGCDDSTDGGGRKASITDRDHWQKFGRRTVKAHHSETYTIWLRWMITNYFNKCYTCTWLMHTNVLCLISAYTFYTF